ncbi:2-oxo acid dehydrogenase subunit E2 [Gammaproteobacteria bacterium]|nr:2-oxo acid dehydrogenase subunit E2 [Gammaproteobacteria bacterium]
MVPDLGDFNDVEIIEIFIAEGDYVNIDDPLITLETEKAAMDIPSPFSGKVDSLFVELGVKISEGDNICELLSEDSDVINGKKEKIEEHIESKKEDSKESTKVEEEFIDQTVSPDPIIDNKTITKSFAGVHASPSVRKLARELGADLTLIKGTGMKRRILPEDLKSHIKAILSGTKSNTSNSLPSIPIIDFSSFGEIETLSLSRIKKISGPRLQASWINIPHVTQHDEIDIHELEQIRIDMKEEAKNKSIQLSILPFIIKAITNALSEFPDFNSSLSSDGKKLIKKKYINIGFAANTEQGLMVPVLRDAKKKSVLDIAKDLSELSELARSGKIKINDLEGGTFTVSSLGGFGGTGFTPIINAPEVAILGIARAQVKPVFNNGQFLPKMILPISLSYDHRVIDGVGGIQFTTYLKQLLENPETFLNELS